jgi:hypothetical protein
MKASTLETLIWVLIYGGLLVLCLSVFVSQRSAALGGTLAAAGGLGAAVGAVLIYVRSRMKEAK